MLASKMETHGCTLNYCLKRNPNKCRFYFPFDLKYHTVLEEKELDGEELKNA